MTPCPVYVYNCDPEGATGKQPAPYNTMGELECACPEGQPEVDGVCMACDPGEFLVGNECGSCAPGTFYRRADRACGACVGDEVTLDGQCVAPREKCDAAGWDFATDNIGAMEWIADIRAAAATAESHQIGPYNAFRQSLENRLAGISDYFLSATRNTPANSYGDPIISIPPKQVCRLGVARGITTAVLQSESDCDQLTEAQLMAQYEAAVPDGDPRCLIPLSAGGTVDEEECYWGGSARTPRCENVFGGNLDFPQRPATGAAPRYVYDCGSGFSPETINTSEAEECTGERPGRPRARLTPEHKVELQWTAPAGATGTERYAVLRAVDGGARTTLAGAEALTTLSWVDDDFAVPAGGTTLVYWAMAGQLSDGSDPLAVHPLACGELFREGGERGSCGECLPAAENGGVTVRTIALSDAARELADAGLFVDVCAPETGADFGAVSERLLCDVFGGRLDDGGEVCYRWSGGEEEHRDWRGNPTDFRGLDAAGTFCLVGPRAGSPLGCRGLFKHVRRCNWVFGRPALNPFLCAPKCRGGVYDTPRGGVCVR